MHDSYTERQRIFRRFKLGFFPFFLPITIVVGTYIYVGYDLTQALSVFSPDYSLAILAIVVSIYSVASDVEKKFPPKTKGAFEEGTIIITMCCWVCYFIGTFWSSNIEKFFIYILFLGAVCTVTIGVLFDKNLHKMHMDEIVQKEQMEKQLKTERTQMQAQLVQVQNELGKAQTEGTQMQTQLVQVQNELEKAQTERTQMQTQLVQVKKELEKEQIEKARIQKELEVVKKELEEKISENIAQKVIK